MVILGRNYSDGFNCYLHEVSMRMTFAESRKKMLHEKVEVEQGRHWQQ